MDNIEQVTTKIIEYIEANQWSAVERLTFVLKELVKIEIAALKGTENE